MKNIVIQLEKRLEALKLRLRLPFRSPADAGSLHSQRSLRASRGSTFFKLNGYILLGCHGQVIAVLVFVVQEQGVNDWDRDCGYGLPFVKLLYYDDPDTDTDTSCFLDVGDHGAIDHKSWVDYSRAEIKAVREIKNGLRKGTIEQLNELVREDVYRRILGGLYTSENTDPRVEMFCRQHVCLDRQ